MIQMPLSDIISKIKEKSELSEAEIELKIDQKLKQLSGLISKEGAAHIIANELGIKLFDLGGKLQIKNVLLGMRNVEVVGKVQQASPVSTFTTKDGKEGKVMSFVIGDETGTMRVAAWHTQTENASKLKEGDIVKIKGGYVRENNGRKEIHLNERSKLMINPEGESVGDVGAKKFERKAIKDLTEDDRTTLLGTIVQVFDPKFFNTCPQCRKSVKEENGAFACRQHGTVTPNPGYVLNVFLDDGTGNIRLVCFRDQVDKLLNKTKEEMLVYKDKPEEFNPIKTELLGTIVKVEGRAVKNQMFDRIEFIANQIDPNPDPGEEIKKLKNDV